MVGRRPQMGYGAKTETMVELVTAVLSNNTKHANNKTFSLCSELSLPSHYLKSFTTVVVILCPTNLELDECSGNSLPISTLLIPHPIPQLRPCSTPFLTCRDG